jgi:hypothetical protein
MPKICKLIVLIILSSMVTGCFKKDEQMVIIENKGNQDVKTIIIPNPYSIYTYNTYIDLDSGKLVGSTLISLWDLGFDASPGGWIIRVNGANSMEIASTGSTDFSADFTAFQSPKWKFDASTGDPDSTAVGKWVTGDPASYEYTNEVYLLGKNNGNGTSSIVRKLRFIELDSAHVRFISALPGETEADTIIINKDPGYRYVYYSFNTPHQTLFTEPPENTWDIVAGSYRTTLYTDAGIPTPYTVRGVLSNYPHVEVIKVSQSDFFAATAKDTTGKTFSSAEDAIGYDWKDYNSKDSNPYRIVPDIYYFVKTRSGNLIKLEFTGYTSANAEYGYPAFRFVYLN